MKWKTIITFSALILLLCTGMISGSHSITEYSGEYATDLVVFEFELVEAVDEEGWLKFYWGFNTTGESIRFELGDSVISEDYEDVYHDDVYLVPLDIFVNDDELDRNVNASLYDYWEAIFWNNLVLPIEDGQYNNFDVLEDQDPAIWDVRKADGEVSKFSTQSEIVYDYMTGVMVSWIYSVTYQFELVLKTPLTQTSETTDIETETSEGGLLDNVDVALPMIPLVLGVLSISFLQRKKGN
ncbi:MAG: hypothetical protein ACXAE3_16955 [Candidatus Kariarchaeaceae archaeon]|jgi:hypothetical protein